MIRRLAQELAFARHIPPRQIAARLALRVRRRVDDTIKPDLSPGTLSVADPAPLPIMPPRKPGMRREGSGWQYEALGHEERFGETIDWDRPGPDGLDQLWRMTLHYMEYAEALDDEAFCALIRQWIAANPPYEGRAAQAAWNAYALSLRTVVWMQQLAERRDRLADDFLQEVHRSLGEQLRYLETHLERDVGGNHLLKNIKALKWGARYFAGPAATRWNALATALLKDELDRQMLADGMHYERSPSYHGQVFADLLEIASLDPPAQRLPELDGTLDKAAQVIALLAHPDGRVAQFSDAGLSMAYPPGECLAAHARIAGKSPTETPPEGAFGLEEAGYFGARDNGAYLVVDAGPISPDSLPAHGHGDIGSFEWSIAGERFVVDQGVYQYVASDRRAQSRSCACHNTLGIAGLDQAAFFGAFRSAHRARLIERTFERDGAGFRLTVAHDGFVRAGGPVHRRTITGHARHFVIEDTLDGPVDRNVAITLLLHPQVAVESAPAEPQAACEVQLRRARGGAILKADRPVGIESWHWWPDMGHQQATKRLRIAFAPGQLSHRLECIVTD